jgi:hypothetical protein
MHKIFIISLIYFIPKWLISFYFFEEDILNKIIFEIDGDGRYYLPFVKYLSELNFTNSFDSQVGDLKNIAIPFGSLFIHSLLYLITGSYSIIIFEFFAVFFFLLVFSNIINFFLPKIYSLPIAIFFLILPLMVQIPSINDLPLIKVFEGNFFNFRIHRPMMTTLLLLLFILVMMSIIQNGWNKKRSFFLGIILAATLSGFYYYFILMFLVITTNISITYKFKYIQFLKDNFKNILILSTTFVFLSLPFIYNNFFLEENFLERIGIVVLDEDKRLKILQYYSAKIFDIKFLTFTFISFLLILFIKKKNFKVYKYLSLFFIIFVSSIISPFLFIALSNKTGLIYHFNNNIIMLGLIFFIISLFCIIFLFYNETFTKVFSRLIYLTFFIIVIGSAYQNFKFIENNKDLKDKRIEINKITKKINTVIKDNKEVSILTFDNYLMIWGIMKNVKEFTVINGIFTSKKNSMIEDDLIDSFKFLGLDQNHFYSFLKNEKQGWRYNNFNVRDFFLMKYQANSLNTYKDAKDFEPEVLNFIKISSPALSQQLAIPNNEFVRLRNKFIVRGNKNFIIPNLIILQKSNFIFKNINHTALDYCKIHDEKFYVSFSNLKEYCKSN